MPRCRTTLLLQATTRWRWRTQPSALIPRCLRLSFFPPRLHRARCGDSGACKHRLVGPQVEKLRKSGATLKFHGTDSERTESHARAYAREHGMVRMSQVFQSKLMVCVFAGVCFALQRSARHGRPGECYHLCPLEPDAFDGDRAPLRASWSGRRTCPGWTACW